METNAICPQPSYESHDLDEGGRPRDDKARGRITQVLLAHGALRIASGANGILIGLYLASLRNAGGTLGAGLVGILSAVSFAAELVASIPMGLASDAISPRWLMTAGAAIGAVAALLFGLTHSTFIFFASRTLEGLSAAAVVPALLAYLTVETEGDPSLRVKVMSFFELTLLAGLGLGGVVASQFYRHWGVGSFYAVGAIYLLCSVLIFTGTIGKRRVAIASPIADLKNVLKLPALRHLAPVWLCVNSVVGLWLGPTLPFLLTQNVHSDQTFAGVYAQEPSRVGWLLLAYSIIFGVGVTGWSFVLPHMSVRRAMTITLLAMLPVCAGFYLLNHSAGFSQPLRWSLTAATIFGIMVESGFTPAALAWLANTLPPQSGRGAAMGIYSVLLSLGAIAGSLLAAGLGQRYSVDGLLSGTVAVAVLALIFLHWVRIGTKHSETKEGLPDER
jgi:MFS family permease